METKNTHRYMSANLYHGDVNTWLFALAADGVAVDPELAVTLAHEADAAAGRLRVRFHIIRKARVENVGKYQSCMVS